MKQFVTWIGTVIGAVPVAVILTFVLSPFWNWFESASGIESMGHSGPATWCYLAIFLIVLSLGWLTWFIARYRKH
ncbi:MAG TPA: hypothetical protein VK968_13245 [Roseimicrobium sp.]|nr:hypothetical protein [Roseimicrobium sp.]